MTPRRVVLYATTGLALTAIAAVVHVARVINAMRDPA